MCAHDCCFLRKTLNSSDVSAVVNMFLLSLAIRVIQKPYKPQPTRNNSFDELNVFKQLVISQIYGYRLSLAKTCPRHRLKHKMSYHPNICIITERYVHTTRFLCVYWLARMTRRKQQCPYTGQSANFTTCGDHGFGPLITRVRVYKGRSPRSWAFRRPINWSWGRLWKTDNCAEKRRTHFAQARWVLRVKFEFSEAELLL